MGERPLSQSLRLPHSPWEAADFPDPAAYTTHLSERPLSQSLRLPHSPSAWEAADFPDPAAYTTHLSPAHLAELEALAVSVPPATPIHAVRLTPARRALAPSFGALVEGLAAEVREGRGFALLKGMPVELELEGMRATCLRYWFFGLFACGDDGAEEEEADGPCPPPPGIRPTNMAGHLIGHVADTGADPAHPTTRLYATAAAQPWHNDSADAVALLCLGSAAEGGGSGWASSAAIHDALVAEDPAAAAALAARGAWFYDRKGEVPAGKAGWFEMPVFNYTPEAAEEDGGPSREEGGAPRRRVFVNLSSNYYLSAAARFPDAVPPLTAAQLAAVSKLEAMAASPRFALSAGLAPGDIQLLNNHTCLHMRAAFVDGPGHRRHLLRLWLSSPADPPLPAVYRELYGSDDLVPGARGGIRVDGASLRAGNLCVPLRP